MTSSATGSAVRLESDALGQVEVPADRYWGAQTQRALENFSIGSEQMPHEVIRAIVQIKRSAARVNMGLGRLDAALSEAIARACDEVLAGELADEFPLHVWQSGSGTQSNMNVNEVLANRASELLGHERGARRPVHPNDHVNLSQSSNDVMPSAISLAAVAATSGALLPALERLRATLAGHASAWARIVKIGRTHLMDATPLTLGQEFSGYAAQLQHACRAIEASLTHARELAIGGTAVGTGLNAPPEFAERMIAELEELTGLQLICAPNKFEALGAHDSLVGLSGALRSAACSLLKIANDIRWLGSGPRCSIAELRLPENEPGSSIMPGKVNPTQCESLAMICVQVLGNDATVAIAGASGNFELNTYRPVIALNVLQSIRLLADGVESFRVHCAEGIEPDPVRIRELLERSLMLVTALTPRIGYDRAAEVAREAHAQNKTLRQVVLEHALMSESEFEEATRPERMVGSAAKA
jgi:fumarate hydratase, class II